jgi:hypothetical protein
VEAKKSQPKELPPKAAACLEKVVEQFKSGDLSAVTQAVRIQIDPNSPAIKWSLSNRVLAWVQAQELDCRGYRQWQEVGRQVKKGSRAVYIFRPITIKNTKEEEEDDYICVGFWPIPVFAASSTERREETTAVCPQRAATAV